MNSKLATGRELTPGEKLDLIAELWDELCQTPEAVPIPAWQIEEVERRSAELAKDPSLGMSWEEVEQRIRSRHGK